MFARCGEIMRRDEIRWFDGTYLFIKNLFEREKFVLFS